jgi:hypothetical protein
MPMERKRGQREKSSEPRHEQRSYFMLYNPLSIKSVLLVPGYQLPVISSQPCFEHVSSNACSRSAV